MGKGKEGADIMERRKVDMFCVQETKCKGSKTRSNGGGFKLFYHGVDEKRNGVGVILKEEYSKSVVEVKRVSDRVMKVKMKVEVVMINVISDYAPQRKITTGWREELWYCIWKSGVAEKYVRVVQDMYEDSVTAVMCAVGTTDWFKVEVELHQRSALSSFLFAVVMDRLTEEVRQEYL
ncbi:hypothetical protein C0J45_1245 [Silurus meridionalis]|nr:hypothetical protein C0J45_1245 [Silurus meridionalis]